MAMITNWMSQTLPSLVGLNTTKLTAATGGTLDRSTGVSAGGGGQGMGGGAAWSVSASRGACAPLPPIPGRPLPPRLGVPRAA